MDLLRPLSALALYVLIAPPLACAQTILLDFGPTTVSATDATVSPAHAVGAVPGSAVTWNKVLLSDIGSGVLSSTGGSTGVSINLGVESGTGSGTISYTTNPAGGSTILGTAAGATSSLYSDTKVARDGIFSGAADVALGLRIDGLAAGEYTLYFTARNTNSGLTSNRGERMYASTGTSSDTFDFSAVSNFSSVANTNSMTDALGIFTAGVSYNTLSFTITGGQSLFLAVDGFQSGENRGFLNSLEIVAVPEPGVPLLFGASVAFFLFRRRAGSQ
ncbi:MAG TPA: PEP-CTERM sorting domain-containing protein [Chthoniobacteraceae bacterium]|nr:PEP-CTERM sorting domain-containing protein [Chthoniobacteraceae bacterium]